ncbi:hypothetical protein AB4Z46_35000 [Variovorax sp. M-6]|uniref:hypothetical protein n=1 Tax=Variovorax sp. M-6 TaxID=3233041 RepID=UPI003F9C900D
MNGTLRVLVEIRLRRSESVQGATSDERLGLWIPDIPPNGAKLAQVAEFAHKLHGNETHWIEERQA